MASFNKFLQKLQAVDKVTKISADIKIMMKRSRGVGRAHHARVSNQGKQAEGFAQGPRKPRAFEA